MSKLVALLCLFVIVYMYMFCLNFILGSNLIFLFCKLIIYFTIPKKQKIIRFEPRTKLNHNIIIQYVVVNFCFSFVFGYGNVC